jgi:F-type H+-transporting ATPase subunit epsilon
MQLELVVPEGEIWAGAVQRVIAKTLEGDIGVLTGHTPVLGILAPGSVVRVLPDGDEAAAGGEVVVAVSEGFLSVAGDRVSILARHAQLGSQVDRAAAQAALDSALEAAAAQSAGGGEEPAEVRYARAVLRAAGDRS